MIKNMLISRESPMARSRPKTFTEYNALGPPNPLASNRYISVKG